MTHRQTTFGSIAAAGVLYLIWVVAFLAGDPPVPAQQPTDAASPEASDPPTAADRNAQAFPTRGILPKEESGALRFLSEHPEFDGRGVVVAIFDTGVDPGAAGLQKTTLGETKIVDMIDGTGSGDVLTTNIRIPTEGTIGGLSGRQLKIPSQWKNPAGRFHVGLKRAYDFFPGELVERLQEKRRKKFTAAQRTIEADLRRRIIDWDTAHAPPTPEEKKQLADIQARLKQLRLVDEKYSDPGPIYDCVVFHDGEHWRAAIDTDEDSDLSDEELLTNYQTEQQYGTFRGDALLNFAVNVYEEGNRLSIVTDCGPHGTHVAGIVAGYFPEHPELNGLAPGARIVSVKIGDPRIGGMELGAGLVRGLGAVVRNGCDLVNMSYGEPTSTPNRGRLTELLSELVHKQGVIFVASAGNSGPALSTVGAPGGTTSAVIGASASVSPAMTAAAYALRDGLPEMPFTWTSRGPTVDGDLGIDILAPGGAIAPVPNWTLRRSRLMNGTSMASPNACGAIALLLSGLKADGTPYSPYSIRRALQNSARTVAGADVFSHGPGLLQVDRAFKALRQHAAATGELLRFAVDLPRQGGARGLYLREPYESRAALRRTVRVRPIFSDTADHHAKVDFEIRLDLEATAEWVEVGEHLLLTHGDRTFPVHVDPTQLEPGTHFAEVRGYDSSNRSRGPLFRLPITVVQPTHVPEHETSLLRGEMQFSAGTISRRFVTVPAGATWADLELHCTAEDGAARRFVIHPVQLPPGESLKMTPTRQYVTLRDGSKLVRSFAVTGGRTLELCLAQYWSSRGTSLLEYTLKFHGLVPDSRQVQLEPAGDVARIEVVSPLGRERLAPRAILKTHRTWIRPKKAVVRPLDQKRDRLPDGRSLYELLLTYEFSQDRAGKVTPRFPATDGLLYDSPLGSQFWLLFDEGKRRVAADDVWPEPISLQKGKHVLKLQLRHTDVRVLERAKGMPLALERPLAKIIPLTIYPSKAAAMARAKKFTPTTMERGEQVALYIASPESKRLPAGVRAGDGLLGNITYGASDASRSGLGQRPGGYPVQFSVRLNSKKTPAEKPAAKTEQDPPADDSHKQQRQFEVSQLRKFKPSKDVEPFAARFQKLLAQHPGHLPLLVARLHWLDREGFRKGRLSAIVETADAVIASIDTEQIAKSLGTLQKGEAAQRSRKQMEEQRNTLVDAHYRKGRALAYMELPDVVDKIPVADPQAHDTLFEQNFHELQKWVDTTAKEYFLLHVRRERRKGRYGNALELLNRYIAASAPKFLYFKKRRDLYRLLGWTHLAEYETKWLTLRFPSDYEPF